MDMVTVKHGLLGGIIPHHRIYGDRPSLGLATNVLSNTIFLQKTNTGRPDAVRPVSGSSIFSQIFVIFESPSEDMTFRTRGVHRYPFPRAVFAAF